MVATMVAQREFLKVEDWVAPSVDQMGLQLDTRLVDY